jgi:hypothetical protein
MLSGRSPPQSPILLTPKMTNLNTSALLLEERKFTILKRPASAPTTTRKLPNPDPSSLSQEELFSSLSLSSFDDSTENNQIEEQEPKSESGLDKLVIDSLTTVKDRVWVLKVDSELEKFVKDERLVNENHGRSDLTAFVLVCPP